MNKDETKAFVDQISLRFIDTARQVEAFFLQKRFLLSALKPELIIREEITDLKLELLRKDEIMKKHYEKVSMWQNLLAEMHGWVQPCGKCYKYLSDSIERDYDSKEWDEKSLYFRFILFKNGTKIKEDENFRIHSYNTPRIGRYPWHQASL